MHLLRKITAAIIAYAMMALPLLADDDTAGREYPIIAAYIYNFTQFTTWPADVPSNRFALCIIGDNPFGELLTPLKNKTARGNNFTLVHLPALNSNASECDVLFVAPSQKDHVTAILNALKGKPILLMSNIEGFADAGGMVEFSPENTRIAMRINTQALESARLTVSSKLLSLARIVNGP